MDVAFGLGGVLMVVLLMVDLGRASAVDYREVVAVVEASLNNLGCGSVDDCRG